MSSSHRIKLAKAGDGEVKDEATGESLKTYVQVHGWLGWEAFAGRATVVYGVMCIREQCASVHGTLALWSLRLSSAISLLITSSPARESPSAAEGKCLHRLCG